MEAKSNTSGHQDAKFGFKFVSEERLNYITQKVDYDKKKKLEDEAWLNFLARKDKSKVKNVTEKQPTEPASHLEVTNVLDTKKNELSQSDEIPSSSNLSHSESNGNILYAFSPNPKMLSFNENSLTKRIGDEALANIHKMQVTMLDTHMDPYCSQNQNEDISFLGSTDADSGKRYHSATNLHNIEVDSTIPLNEAANTTLKHSSANERKTMDYVVVHENTIQEETLLHETNRAVCTINKGCLEQLKVLWLKILLHLNGILCLYVKAPEQENSEEYLLHQMRATEFTALFARNYVYSLRRMIQELHELVDAATIARQNTRTANKIHVTLVAAHQAASKALITYLKRMPYPVVVEVPDKLSELLHLIIDMCAMCSLFGIESAELKKGPDEVKHKCQYMLIQIQDQKKQLQISIDEQHSKVLSVENKKISSQNHKKKLKHYSLAMYKPTVPLKTIPKSYKNKIKNLAKVKFGPVPKRHNEVQESKTGAIEQKFKRHHTEVTSPKRIQRTAKAKKTHRPMKTSQDNKIEWVGKFDDSDNILTLVELFGQKEVANDPEETHVPYADKMRERQTHETKGETSDVITKGDSGMRTYISENVNFPNGQEIKLGPPNAQLILLPPYQLSSCEGSKQSIDDQYQTNRKDNVTLRCAECERCSESQIALPKIGGRLNRNSEHLKNEETNESRVPLTRSCKYQVQKTYNQNSVVASPAECLQASHSDTLLIPEQARVVDNITASISYLKTSQANMNEQIPDFQNQQQEVISEQDKLPQTLLEEKWHSKHDSILLKATEANIYQLKPATLHVSDQQLSLVFKYVHQCENLLQTSLIHQQQLKPWSVVNMLSDQLVDSSLRSVVAELDFDALLSNIYRLEFQ